MTQDTIDVIVPKWFIQFAGIGISIFLMTAVPLEVWQTRSMMRVEVKMEHMEDWGASLDSVRAEQIKRSGNVAVVEEMRVSLRSIEQRLSRLEARLEVKPSE